MFNLFNKKKKSLVSPITGKAVPMDEVPDPVFSQKILGDGVGIIPINGEVVSPCDGEITLVVDSLHSVAITSTDGLEIIIHLGLETVGLNGEGFKCLVNLGDKVKKGQKVLEMDLGFVTEKGLKTISPVIITNMDHVKGFATITGDVRAGETDIITYS